MELTANPLFGLVISIFIFEFFKIVQKKTRMVILNPLILTMAAIIVILLTFHIPLENYDQGGVMLKLFITPATCALALSIYNNYEILKEHLLPILGGCFVGSLTAVLSSYFLCRLFGLSEQLTMSVVPKSVTTPIALALSESLGGIDSITLACVTIAGIGGCIFAPALVKIFHIKNPVAAGIGIGSCSHALGTTKAIEMGEVEGAMSGIAIGISGIMTVLIVLLL
ncbi:LrgB family protein [Anaerolentibacter hominis]|uniref:LrgB family protein n=1 Tax=Anaerolentibacter hominis TaxID=3079009 RepID=UPI0031B85214